MRALFYFLLLPSLAMAKPVVIGSKAFTESVILGEVLRQLVAVQGGDAVHRAELGGTQVLWKALERGDIDAYVEYTGTLSRELLSSRERTDTEIRRDLSPLGLDMTRPLGFNDTYALGMKRKEAERLGIHRLSDLTAHPELVLGLSHEFLDRAEGWPNVKARYGLSQTDIRGMQHELAYRALESGDIAVTDLYSTDAEIRYYDLATLVDDRNAFPPYQAVVVYRKELETTEPEAVAAFKKLEGKIDEAAMIEMNSEAKLHKARESAVAAAFLQKAFGVKAPSDATGLWDRLWKTTREHLYLVLVSMTGAILISLPLGVLAVRRAALGELILGGAGVLQTIPSLALLVFMIPILGIGAPPAIFALFLYSLLPIIRNTYTGLKDIPPALLESADALGLPRAARLFRIELPLASRSILAGIKTSAVINVGTATLGALIGAGGYGEPILIGIRRDDIGMILQGAVPAAVLALLVQAAFYALDRICVPKGLRLRAA